MGPDDWENFKRILPFIPLDVFLKINFTDPQIIQYFGQAPMQPNQLSLIAEIINENFDSNLYENVTSIANLGNIFCELIMSRFFINMTNCSINKLNYLGQLAQNYEILGPSRTWDLNKIEIVGSILAGLTEQQFRELQIEACKGIKPNVIRMIPEKKLKIISTLKVSQQYQLT
ncbi:hypothetical protein Phum_PHUM025300 [Pediculus humanus corporis]|uniref:Uncharacterized protein n=1 Tax=Pediculus humanus subsp. corporis TaxID=121224 RepID=E0VA09_PEDHC|nr:uncharacterized protein Phum_PHUM025300 [Pediculus humanus corporis]EEB10215.1 hypothetical protein Phum_PHUM025300 [Pediculus humanus corporis]